MDLSRRGRPRRNDRRRIDAILDGGLEVTINDDADAIARRLAKLDDATIDELYGLEPVYEPAVAAGRGASPVEVVVVTCPYCWEQFETQADLTGGSSTYVEDCQVCCQPIELSLVVGDSGALVALLPNRMD